MFRKNFGDIEVDIFFEKYDFDYKRSLANALAADDINLEMKDEDLETENVGQDRPRSGKEARQRRAERIASASGRDRKIECDDSDLETDTEDDQPVNYEEYER